MRKRLIRSVVTVLTACMLLITPALSLGEAAAPGDDSGTLLIAFGMTRDYSAIQQDYLVLARLLAAQALEAGDNVKLVRLNNPGKPWDLASGVPLSENLQDMAKQMRMDNRSDASNLMLMKSFSDKLDTLASKCSGSVDFWLFSPDARLHAAYNADEEKFNSDKAPSILKNLTKVLAEYPDLTLHLVWRAEDSLPETERFLDDVLKEQLPAADAERLIIHVLPDTDGNMAYGVSLFRSASALNVSLPAEASDNGRYHFVPNGQDTLLQLTGVTDALQASWKADADVPELALPEVSESPVVPDGTDDAIIVDDATDKPSISVTDESLAADAGLLPEGVTVISADTYVDSTAWILISGDCPAGTLTLTDSLDFEVQAFTHIDDVTLSVKAADGSDLDPYEPLTWNREDNQLLLSADIPEFIAEQAVISLNGMTLSAEPQPYKDGVASWKVTIPAQSVGAQELTLSMSFDSDGLFTLESEPVAINVENRLPEINEDALESNPFYESGSLIRGENGLSMTFVTYSGVPGGTDEGPSITLDLDSLFTDPDGDELSFSILPNHITDKYYSYCFDESSCQIYFTPKQGHSAAIAEKIIPLYLCDGYGNELTCQLTFQQTPVANVLNYWTLVQDPDSPQLKYGEETSLAYTLSAEDAAFYDTLVRQYASAGKTLPSLQEALGLVVQLKQSNNDVLATGCVDSFVRQDDGSFRWNVTIKSFTQELQDVRLAPSVTLNGEKLSLNIRFSTNALSLTNDPPAYASAAHEGDSKLRLSISGAPGNRKPLEVELFQGDQQEGAPFVPAEFFTDDHGMLRCSLKVTGPVAPTLTDADGQDVPVSSTEDSSWRWDLEQIEQAYTLRLQDTGDYTVTLWARDDIADRPSEELPSFTWSIHVSSSFTRNVIIAVVVAVVVIALIVVLLILWQRSRPSFNAQSGLAVCLSPYEYGSVSLGPCGKSSTTLARVMISCQLYPPRGITMDALNDIVLSPAKGHRLQVQVGRRAAEQLRLSSAETYSLEKGKAVTLANRIQLMYYDASPDQYARF
ncbi:MAG: hypothetical protein ACI4O7_02915 [Aristaeellaceae bacterium]